MTYARSKFTIMQALVSEPAAFMQSDKLRTAGFFIGSLYVRLILKQAESFEYYRSIYALLNFDQKRPEEDNTNKGVEMHVSLWLIKT